jgi:hypothetical protein
MSTSTSTNSTVKPALFMDFDGVLNYEGSKSAYRNNPDTLGYLRTDTLWIPEGRYDIKWSGELVRKLNALDASWVWLTSWRDYASNILSDALGLTGTSMLWWDFVPGQVDHRNKFPALVDSLSYNPRPFVWVDDEATKYFDKSMVPNVPYLLVAPDPDYGMTKADLADVTDFVAAHTSS